VSRDQPIGDVVQVSTDDLWLRADSQEVIANPLDQGSLPARSNGAKGVPGMAGDETELRGRNSEGPFNLGIGLSRRLVMFDAVCAKATLEKATILACPS